MGDTVAALQLLLRTFPNDKEFLAVSKSAIWLRVGRWFKPGESACILPDRMAEVLGVKANEVGVKYIRIFGKELKVIGLIDSDKMRAFVDLDEEILTPADFQVTDDEFITVMTQTEDRERQGLEQPEVETMPFEHLDPDEILIVPYALLRDVGSVLSMFARASDEAHRASNALRIKLGKRRTLKSKLDDVPGVGSKTKTALLRNLGSMRRIVTADEEALVDAGATRRQARAIVSHLGQSPEDATASEDAAIDNAFTED